MEWNRNCLARFLKRARNFSPLETEATLLGLQRVSIPFQVPKVLFSLFLLLYLNYHVP
ncbi:hypothetical protein OIU79_008185 [Salix purpurea]|uniref:Uncharacterized protein n=1 Tax=Salix purpurea TaxID=77065 RepID=A0A9Q0THR7_SALPP|nr:hypothetical protein OIU79_008185 [Salix purpurea]